jgi:AcrR family transcriptional regulator
MGTKERKQRERAEREQRFLDAARGMILRDGILNLQMARLADACDYATGTLYQHFASKEDLLVAVVADGTKPDLILFEQASRWQESSRLRMFAIAVVDAVCSARCAVQAKLMQYVFTEAVWENASQERRQELTDAVHRVAPLVERIVEDGIAAGDLDPGGLRPMELAIGPWSLIHGMYALSHVQGLLPSIGVRQADDLLYRQMLVYLNGMNWQPLIDPSDSKQMHLLVERVKQEVIHPPEAPGASQ